LCPGEDSICSDGNDSLETIWLLGVSLNNLNWESGHRVNILTLLSVYVREWIFGVFFVSNVELSTRSLLLRVALDDLHWESCDWINVFTLLGMNVEEWVLSVLFVGNILKLEH